MPAPRFPVRRPAYPSKRPAPRLAPHQASGPAPNLDDIVWDRILNPRELYRIEYIDRNDEISVREIQLLKLGTLTMPTAVGPIKLAYLGVVHDGKFKTMRADRVRMATQLSSGHPSSIRAQPTYSTHIPAFPVPGAIFRMPTVKGNRTWLVDLNLYTCTCPEKRQRGAMGYAPGQLGFVCSHIAHAILDHLPADANWPPELLDFLRNPRRIHLDNLTA